MKKSNFPNPNGFPRYVPTEIIKRLYNQAHAYEDRVQRFSPKVMDWFTQEARRRGYRVRYLTHHTSNRIIGAMLELHPDDSGGKEARA